MTIQIFTDGACRGSPGPGGWAALLRYQKIEKTLYGAVEHTTNNRMELTAAVVALQTLKRACEVDLYTDSQYLQQGMKEWLQAWKKNAWKNSKKEPVKNADLWRELDKMASMHRIHWHWVKGHSGHEENERVDALANRAIDEFLAKRQEG